ncbi:MAG: hypothetical protein STSR0004_19940 [Peptococcaceae bacterium]
MISTVTTTTVTTTTAMAAGLGILATLALILALIAKELAGAWNVQVAADGKVSGMGYAGAFERVLNVAIIPLLIVFGFIVLVKIVEVLP